MDSARNRGQRSGDLAHAWTILEIEQRALVPTPEELKRARALRAWVLLLLAGLVLFGALFFGLGEPVEIGTRAATVINMGSAAFTTIAAVGAVLGILTVGALVACLHSLSVVKKFWALETLRRRLGLHRLLRPRFRRAWRRRWVRSSLAIALGLTSLLLIVAAIYLLTGSRIVLGEGPTPYWLRLLPLPAVAAWMVLVAKLWAIGARKKSRLAKGTAIFAALVPVLWLPILVLPVAAGITGVAALLFFLVGQGEQRMEVVRQLQESLGESGSSARSVRGPVGAEAPDLDVIARLERGQVMLERQESIRAGEEEGPGRLEVERDGTRDFPEYSSKYSRAAMESRRKLAAELLPTVEQIERKLAEGPEQSARRLVPASLDGKSYIYDSPDPVVQITFQVDTENKVLYFFHYSAPALKVRRSVFISYSHSDEQWLELVRTFLSVLEQQGVVEFWDDREIEAGEMWEEEIRKALDGASVFVLLVSQQFLTSDFIRHQELPRALEGAISDGKKIFWIPVSPSTVFDTHPEITQFRSPLKNPSTSLEEMSGTERKRALVRLSRHLAQAIA